MKQNIDLDVLIKYQEGKLSKEESQRVETFLSRNPHYLSIFEGLEKMKKQINVPPLEHIKKKKAHLKK